MCYFRRWTLWRADLANIEPQILTCWLCLSHCLTCVYIKWFTLNICGSVEICWKDKYLIRKSQQTPGPPWLKRTAWKRYRGRNERIFNDQRHVGFFKFQHRSANKPASSLIGPFFVYVYFSSFWLLSSLLLIFIIGYICIHICVHLYWCNLM